jgi:hypothetical protein
MSDPRTPIDDLRVLSTELDGIKRRLDSLESPSGTQAFRTVAKLSALVENIQQQLDAYNATRWTNAQIQAQINAAIAAAFAGNVTITGSLTVNGALAAASLSTAGSLTAGGAVSLPGARGTDLTSASSRVTAWLAGDGRLGHT